MEEPIDHIQQLRGRAAFLRNRGEVKSPELMERAADLLASRCWRKGEYGFCGLTPPCPDCGLALHDAPEGS